MDQLFPKKWTTSKYDMMLFFIHEEYTFRYMSLKDSVLQIEKKVTSAQTRDDLEENKKKVEELKGAIIEYIASLMSSSKSIH